MKFLITGITGHLGPHLANVLLREGHEVYGLHRRTNGGEMDIADILGHKIDKINFIYGDLLDFHGLSKVFKLHQFDGIFHLAAQSNPGVSATEPLLTISVNVVGTANVIQAIIENSPNCKLLFVSTSEAYGNSINVGDKITESHPLEAANPYSASKVASDLYLQERMRNKKINAVITRAFSHCCPRRGKNFSISSDAYQVAKMMLGEQDKVLKVGNLKTTRVVVDGRDVAEAYYLLMMNEKSTGEVFNICGDTPHEMDFYTNLIIEASGLSGIVKEIYKPFYRECEIFYQHGDSSKVRNLTGWNPKIKIETTMKDILDYWVKKLS